MQECLQAAVQGMQEGRRPHGIATRGCAGCGQKSCVNNEASCPCSGSAHSSLITPRAQAEGPSLLLSMMASLHTARMLKMYGNA